MEKHSLESLPGYHIEIAGYDAAWPERFRVERDRVATALGDLEVTIEHSGSTAVPNMAAKPIIDVLVGLADFADAPQTIAPLEAIGYASYGELRPGWMFFRTDNPHDRHLHVVALGGEAWHSQLDFRNALRADPDLVAAYERVKIDLAERFADDRAGYTTGKTEFVQSVLTRVRAAGD
jgi:GrpB-like predicted nucleotidyltransferase (UPF0157 family)